MYVFLKTRQNLHHTRASYGRATCVFLSPTIAVARQAFLTTQQRRKLGEKNVCICTPSSSCGRSSRWCLRTGCNPESARTRLALSLSLSLASLDTSHDKLTTTRNPKVRDRTAFRSAPTGCVCISFYVYSQSHDLCRRHQQQKNCARYVIYQIKTPPPRERATYVHTYVARQQTKPASASRTSSE